MTFGGKVKYGKMLKHKVLKIFIQDGSNDDHGLALSFSLACSNLLSELIYGKSSWILEKILHWRFFTFSRCLSYFDSYKISKWFKLLFTIFVIDSIE